MFPMDIIWLILLGALFSGILEEALSPKNPWSWWFNILVAFTYYVMVIKPYENRKNRKEKPK